MMLFFYYKQIIDMKTNCTHEHKKLCFNKDLSQYWFCPDCKEIIQGIKMAAERSSKVLKSGIIMAASNKPTRVVDPHNHPTHAVGGVHQHSRAVSRNLPGGAGRNR